jgi:16S rRNA (guanine(1405)-N(7))-methyltransferase
MDENDTLDRLVNAVQANRKYRLIDPGLIRSIGQNELLHRRNFKLAVKTTRNKLHQVGGAYQDDNIDYPRLISELEELPHHIDNQALRDFCRRVMTQHASTRERLPILETFYQETLASLAPIQSIPWMPLTNGAAYFACDIYQDMISLVNQFFTHIKQPGSAEVLNLAAAIPDQPVQVAFLLKTLPCLDQLDKMATSHLLESINAPYLVISYPAHSLGGRSKGMILNYEAHFNELSQGRHWKIHRFEYTNELVFLISR